MATVYCLVNLGYKIVSLKSLTACFSEAFKNDQYPHIRLSVNNS